MQSNRMKLHVLPLRGMVVFPKVTVHLDVGREKSIRALELAMAADQTIFLVNQRVSQVEDPTEADLYPVGTIAKIKQMLKLPNGAIRIFVEALSRGEMGQVYDYGSGLSAEIVPMEDELDNPIKAEALARVLKEEFEKFFTLLTSFSPDELNRIMEMSEPSALADQIAQVMPISPQVRQALLGTTNVSERIRSLIETVRLEQKIHILKSQIDFEVKEAVEQNQREFFLREQLKIIQKELKNVEGTSGESNEFVDRIKAAGMPEKVEEKALKELERFETIPSSSPESGVIRTYLTWLIDLPWSKESKQNLDMEKVQKVLDEDHYGLVKVKERIIEYLAVQKMTNSLKAPIICLVGPPGVGKTSLARSIARAVKREYVRISLGGVRDEAEIRGHRRTYIGAMPGRIIQGIKKAGTNNPVFLLDEIDKLASDFRGDPASALLEVLDPEQNHTFSDHYIEEAFDCSKVMFIATANELAGIPEPLRDRMEIIELSSYTEIEKFQIAKKHLIPKQLALHGLKKSQLTFRPKALTEIIRHYTREAGVRSLERQIGAVCRKVTRKLVSGEVEKIVIDHQQLAEFLGKPLFDYKKSEKENQIGVATGLAYTAFGGDTLQIEVSLSKGKGKLILTGKLGDVMKESAQAALSYVRSNAQSLKIDDDITEKLDIHIHVPEGAVPKDGPSAGITMTTALVSALTSKPVDHTIGMTGEVTLRGRVLPIGGLKEKAISAHRSGLKTIICPADNEKDMDEIPAVVREEMKFVFVSHVDEVLKLALIEGKD